VFEQKPKRIDDDLHTWLGCTTKATEVAATALEKMPALLFYIEKRSAAERRESQRGQRGPRRKHHETREIEDRKQDKTFLRNEGQREINTFRLPNFGDQNT